MAENCNECCISWIRGSDYAEVTAYNGSTLKNTVLNLQKENPEDVKILAKNKDGSIYAHVPIKYVPKIRKPRQVSEEFKQKASERLKEYHTKSHDNYEDNSPYFE